MDHLTPAELAIARLDLPCLRVLLDNFSVAELEKVSHQRPQSGLCSATGTAVFLLTCSRSLSPLAH